MKKSTIFKHLLVKVILPILLVFIGSALLIIQNEIDNYIETHGEKNKKIAENIQNILVAQDFELDLIDEGLGQQMREYSSKLVNEIFKNTDSIEIADLADVREKLYLNSKLVDIYIINSDGIIVNTTFEKDLNMNTFKSFGREFKSFISKVFEDKDFKTDKFSPEKKTTHLRKYSYQSTIDRKYVIELGYYSNKARDITKRTTFKLNEIAQKEDNIISVDLFLGSDGVPIPFNDNKAIVDKQHENIFKEVMLYRYSILTDPRGNPDYTDAIDTIQIEKGKKMHYLYSYIKRENATLFGDAVIRIKSNRSTLDILIKKAIIRYSIIFGVAIIALIIIIMFVTRSITNPLNRLVQKVNRISEGNLHERAEERGSKEIYSLAKHFNLMLDELEESYNNLEQKVIARTAEIYQQKEEIETQRDQIESQRDTLVENNNKLQLAYKNIQEQKNHIEDSIHYAKRIQTAILPTGAILNESLSGEHFVLYKPKDIVSGDFYWVARKDGKTILVVADCTGHGVPGAFMSMIGNTLLNKIINEYGVEHPNDILDRLREEVISALNQKGSDHESKDGMDLVLCSFDFESKSVEFAGAYNPVFQVRNHELIIHKGDKQPIGHFIAGNRPFTNHTIAMESGDMIYMFTDGYQDQFGGPNDKKFMTKRFKKLLTDISHESCSDQKEILNNTIENWMVNTNQIDDILIIGIRIK